ncbi:MAG: hypothetical protein KIT07_07255 [Anaerolineales bacterium]|nr:hypothetical protein [Anaerolineales bacterium]
MILRRSFLTLLVGSVLLSACFVPMNAAEPTSEDVLPTATASETPVWFPPTPTPSPFPTAVLSPTPDMRPGVTELLLADDFSDASLWSTSRSASASAQIANGRLTLVLKSAHSYLVSTRSEPVFRDFYAELTATTSYCHAEDEYGLVLRAQDGNHFRFALSCDGRAKVDRFYNGALSRQADWLSSGAVPSLAPSTTRLGVWAAGGQMHFFVNDFYLFSVTDSLLYRGTLGAFVHAASESDISVGFSDLKVWQVER